MRIERERERQEQSGIEHRRINMVLNGTDECLSICRYHMVFHFLSIEDVFPKRINGHEQTVLFAEHCLSMVVLLNKKHMHS